MAMKPLGLLPYYVAWHYGQALKNIAAVTRNLIWFFWHFFSIGLLLSTLFTPWQRIHEERPKNTIDLGPILSTILINTLMRIAGAIIRLFVIALGVITILGTLAGSIIFFVLWLALPLALFLAFVLGLIIFLKPS